MRLIIPIIFLITAVAIFFVWTDKYLEIVRDLNKEAGNYNYILDRDKRIKELREEKVSEVKSISKENLDKLDKILPSKIENIKLLIDMTDIISRNGLILKSINTQSAMGSSSEGMKTASLDFAVISPYENFLIFLGDIEKSLRILEIKNLNLASTEKEELYNFTIKAVTFWE